MIERVDGCTVVNHCMYSEAGHNGPLIRSVPFSICICFLSRLRRSSIIRARSPYIG